MTNHATLLARYQNTRMSSEQLCKPLLTEEYVIQGMEDTSSPTSRAIIQTKCGRNLSRQTSCFQVSYRNFFQPEQRWHFCGIRLVKD